MNINGINLDFSTDEGEELILSVTNSQDNENVIMSLAEWLRSHQKNS